MIICIDCKANTKDKMDSLLEAYRYKDYSEIIAIAIDNLWVLEREVAEKGSLVIGAEIDAQSSSPAISKVGSRKGVTLLPRPDRSKNNVKGAISSGSTVVGRIPHLFLAEGLDKITITTGEMLPVEKQTEYFTLDRWLFGQYNKILPLKANCRAMLRITAEFPDGGASLEDIVPRVAKAAMSLGDYLADHDRRYNIGRDDTLATAFPGSSGDSDKSCTRYINQFVGSFNSQGVLAGLMGEYRMISPLGGIGSLTENHGKNVPQSSIPRLLLTDAGVQFARMTNPVLDACQNNPMQKFSSEETTFILNHIRTCVPVEDFAFRAIIKAINDGADTPELLDDALRIFVPTKTNRSLSPSFLTSQRSGALSRMVDLGLIERERKGVRVLYKVTERGQHFIKSS